MLAKFSDCGQTRTGRLEPQKEDKTEIGVGTASRSLEMLKSCLLSKKKVEGRSGLKNILSAL